MIYMMLFVRTVNRFLACFSFKQCGQCICNAIDRHDAAVSEEFYDNLVTCDIKSVDCLIGALLVEPSAVQRLKGDIIYLFGRHGNQPFYL